MSLPWKRIVIHHSWTQDSGTLSWPAIRRVHTDPPPLGRGWPDIAYHAGIEVYQARGNPSRYECLFGRSIISPHPGTHAPGANEDGLAFLFVGNFDVEGPEQEMLRIAAEVVIAPWVRIFGMDFPRCIVGHREVTQGRTCPGKLFNMDALVGYISRALNAGSGAPAT